MAGTTTRAPAQDGTLVVALAAALWGLDGLFRAPLVAHLDATTIVVWEHILATVVLLPWLPGAVRAFRQCGWRERLALLGIGVGASAVATILFTEAFATGASTGDFITPLVLQKLQPLFAVGMAMVLLRERLRPGYALYLVPALVGAWLLTFPTPLHVHVAQLVPALLAVAAAFLWAGGTVLGRYVSHSVAPRETTALRYVFGLLASFAVLRVLHKPLDPGVHSLPRLALLAVVPGLLALVLYYRGLRRTPAARATLAELAFPATAAVVGVVALHSHLGASQWVGMALIVAAVLALSRHERRAAPVVAAPSSLGDVALPVAPRG